MPLTKITVKCAICIALLFTPAKALGQYEPLCMSIQQMVSARFKDSKLHRNDAASYGCDIEFKRPDLSITVEVSKARRDARKEVDKTVRIFRTVRIDEPLEVFEKLNSNGTWDKAVIITPRERGNSYVIVLLRKNSLITILSENKESLFDVEEVLRRAPE